MRRVTRSLRLVEPSGVSGGRLDHPVGLAVPGAAFLLQAGLGEAVSVLGHLDDAGDDPEAEALQAGVVLHQLLVDRIPATHARIHFPHVVAAEEYWAVAVAAGLQV
jgi:hypothetical protein